MAEVGGDAVALVAGEHFAVGVGVDGQQPAELAQAEGHQAQAVGVGAAGVVGRGAHSREGHDARRGGLRHDVTSSGASEALAAGRAGWTGSTSPSMASSAKMPRSTSAGA